ncbi:MAG: acyl-CoA dehydrogenase family protein [Acidimicrobiales bacterium]
MDLEFSEAESELRDNVRTVLGDLCPPSLVRSIYEGKGTGNALWERMVELYWPALAIDEEFGGLGMGFLEVAIVAEELGRAVAPGPFLATVTQFVPAVGELGFPEHHGRFLAPVAAGKRTGTLAVAEKGRWDAAAIETVARRSDDGWVLDGKKTTVLDGDCADDIVVIARAEGTAGLGAFVVEGLAVKAQARTVIDPTLRIADLVLTAVPVPPDRVLAEPGSSGVTHALERVLQQATVAIAVSTVGTCRRIFELTLDYAKMREQYGRPIGSFQALKHRLAEMYLAVERASSLCYFAALTIAEDDPRRAEAAALAKSAAGDCQRLLAQDGLQLHGGIGFTWEHDLHFFLKRAKSGEALFGTAATHRAALAHSLGLVGTGSGPERG